jgi:hypothetical protein
MHMFATSTATEVIDLGQLAAILEKTSTWGEQLKTSLEGDAPATT